MADTPLPAPHCQCLYEIENRLPRSMFCFLSCKAQREILKERALEEKQRKENLEREQNG